VYGPTANFMSNYLKEKLNIETTFISGENIDEFRENIRENTTLIYLESPSSAVFGLQDLEAVAPLAKENRIKTIWAKSFFLVLEKSLCRRRYYLNNTKPDFSRFPE